MKSVATLVFILVSICASADTELSFDDGSTVLVRDSKVLFGDADTSILYPGSGSAMTVIDHPRQRYMVIDEMFADTMSSQITAAMAQLEAQLAQLPPEQRAMMQQMMKDRLPDRGARQPQRQFRRTGGEQKIAGFTCQEGELTRDGQPEFKVCIASAGDIGMPDDDFEALSAAFRAMSGIVERFAPGSEKIFDLDLIGGVPVISTDADGAQNSRLISVSFEAIDAVRLEVPEGYARQDPATGL